MTKRARVIYNPVSGRELIKKALPDILRVYEKAGYETSAFCTEPEPFSAKKEARRAALAGFDLVVAAGGDGTINEVVDGISELERRPKMAIIPAGTTNDYARALHIPRHDFVKAAEVIYKDQTVKMDIGKVKTKQQERHMVNIGAAGYLTEVTYEVPANMKAIFGNLAYFVKGAEMLPRIRPVYLNLEYEGGVYQGKASMFFAALTNSVGGFEEIAPDKVFGDGKFTLIIVKTSNLLEILRLVTHLMNGGKHVNSSKILYVKTDYIRATTLGPNRLMINVDGEYGGDAPVEFIALRQHVEMVADTDSMEIDIDPRDLDAELKEEAFIEQLKQLEESEPMSPDDVEIDSTLNE
ncbi:diacylglycerol kinase [Lacticigenium naphthae]|uniref:diacylglycerol kinase n=1 Tax=Lacticigenium naphthae TaxID=515351 RepID=UPI0003F7DA8A|nr:diacylglycerol kinase [Lacticigenium naphthae]